MNNDALPAAEDDLASQYLETEDAKTPFWVFVRFQQTGYPRALPDYHKLGLYALLLRIYLHL